MPEMVLSCSEGEYVCRSVSVGLYRKYTEIMERNEGESAADAVRCNSLILRTVF